MKLKRLLVLTSLFAVVPTTMTGCGNKPQTGGSNTLQIRCYKGGYGTDWLHSAVTAFEAAFPDKKVIIEEESEQVTEKAKLELADPKNNQIDLYFTNGVHMNDAIAQSQSVLRSREKVLLEDLGDILEQPGIAFDGKEESTLIKDRLFEGYDEACRYHGRLTKWQDHCYYLPWADAMTGVFCNKSILDKMGIDLPLTSDEFEDACIEIYSQTKTTDIYPWSWSGTNAVGYWDYLYETWFAQYSGQEAFNNFIKCMPESGDIKEDGYEVFRDKGILEGLKAMYQVCDLDYASNGTTSKDHMTAQNEFMRGKSVFMCGGDWLMNEMKGDYFEEAKNVVFLQTPILSVLGTENGLTDSQLHDVVKYIDQGKTDNEIYDLMPVVTEKALAKIRDARSIHDGIGTGHSMYIPSYADGKDVAKLFIRFLYSNDGCRNFRNNAYANLPLTYQTKAEDTNYPFQQSLDAVIKAGKPKMVSTAIELNDIRSSAQIFIFNCPGWAHVNTFKDIMIDKAEGALSQYTAQSIYEDEAQYMEDNWDAYMEYVS